MGRLDLVAVPATNPEALASFYSKILGHDFARSLSEQVVSYWAPAGSGVLLEIEERLSEQATPMPFFQVDDLDGMIGELEGAGAKLLFGPVDMPIPQSVAAEFEKNYQQLYRSSAPKSMGQVAGMLDPEGNRFSLVRKTAEALRMFDAAESQSVSAHVQLDLSRSAARNLKPKDKY
jgi:predicted enzyme related to lactoylglutathione lyase